MLALTYSYHLISCGLLLLECSQGVHILHLFMFLTLKINMKSVSKRYLFQEAEALARYGPLTVIIFYQLIQISVTFELIGSEVRIFTLHRLVIKYFRNENIN